MALLLMVSLGVSTASGQATADSLHVVSVGQGGPSVIVLHGGPGFRHNYLRPEWDELSDVGAVLYYDQRGCGLSTRQGPFTWQQHVRDLDQLVRERSDERPVILAGSSWGSILAILYAHVHADRVAALVLSGVPPWGQLIDRARSGYERSSANQRAALDSLDQRESFDPSMWAVKDSAWMADESGAPPGDILTPRIGDVCLLPGNTALLSLYSAPGLNELSTLLVPTLILDGDQPDPRGSGAVALARTIPDAEMVIVQGAGHDPWLDQPNQFFQAVRRFLASQR